ncbi:MAG: hypothetical protein JKY17_07630 [Magnetovibrio sp.]|nr:hypothetical protein [Magnetovibrio sp.]
MFVLRGNDLLKTLLAFSIDHRCHGECGSQSTLGAVMAPGNDISESAKASLVLIKLTTIVERHRFQNFFGHGVE